MNDLPWIDFGAANENRDWMRFNIIDDKAAEIKILEDILVTPLLMLQSNLRKPKFQYK